jgi:hypothetical protein
VTLCTDDCMVGGRFWANGASNDGQCDDGGDGSQFSDCALGTDCADCGSREFTSCSNDCGWANDGKGLALTLILILTLTITLPLTLTLTLPLTLTLTLPLPLTLP